MPEEPSTEHPNRPAARRSLNDLLATEAFARGEAVARHYPVTVFLQVASACNLDCYMCSEHLRPPEARRGRNATSLPPELFARLERELLPYARQVTIGLGGEPMISPHFLDYVRRVRAAGCDLHVMTNGTRIHNEEAASTLAQCTKSMEISIDAATKKTYERIRLGAGWGSVRNNLERLRQARLRSPVEERTHLTLCFVLMKSNAHELPDFVEFGKEMGADRVSGWHVIGVTEEGSQESMFDEPQRSNDILAAAKERARQVDIEVDFPLPFPIGDGSRSGEADSNGGSSRSPASQDHATGSAALEASLAVERAQGVPREPVRHSPGEGRIHCSSPTNSVFVFYDGRVFPCCHPHAHSRMEMGSLLDSSFEEIWNGRLYRNLRTSLVSGPQHVICKNCSIVHSPPPENESEEAENSVDLAEFFGDKDLAPLDEVGGVNRSIELLAPSWEDMQKQVVTLKIERDSMRTHIENLEKILRKIHGVPIYRLLGAAKAVLQGRRPWSDDGRDGGGGPRLN